MLWKTPWGKRAPYSEMPYFVGFDTDSNAQFYAANPDPITIDPVSGAAFGFVVAMNAPPAGFLGEVIAQSGDPNEGWELMVEDLGGGDLRTIGFTFRVFGGAGEVGSAVSANVFLANVNPPEAPSPVFVPIIAGFIGTAQFGGDGAVFIVTPNQGAGAPGAGLYTQGALSAPYVNTNPILRVGVNASGMQAFVLPNGVHGLVGAKATWPAVAAGPAVEMYDAWYPSIITAQQIVALPAGTVTPGVQTGWRAPLQPSGSAAPLSVDPFVGAAQLQRGFDPGLGLSIELASPAFFSPENLYFPFGPT